jgi:hypothetical protein
MSQSDNHDMLAVALLGVGLLLLIASFAVPHFTRRMRWTDELAMKFQQASLNYHDALHGREAGKGDADQESAFAQSQAEFTALESRLNNARKGSQDLAYGLQWAGALLMAAGMGRVIWYRIARNRAGSASTD